MNVPDVIGYVLDEALTKIGEKGFFIDNIFVTKPVKATNPLGIARVVRISLIGETKLQLVVAYQDYEKGGVDHGLQNH
jgi:hypothetical protein